MEQQSPVSGATTGQFQSYQLKAAKIILALSTLVFFLNYFFVGGGFYYDITVYFIAYTYTIFILSFLLYMYFFLMTSFMGKAKIVGIMLFVCIAGVMGFAMLPVIFKQAIISF